MPVSEAQKKASRKWDEANRGRYYRCTVIFQAEEKEMLHAQAAAHGLTVSEYIRSLVLKDMGGEIL